MGLYLLRDIPPNHSAGSSVDDFPIQRMSVLAPAAPYLFKDGLPSLALLLVKD